ncbi:MAG: hypothetical protein KKB31_01765, partial [Nanoarchaeota archaeon]|nr:hypothetical protein [Nanoarchaeota archaeon]
MRKLIIYGLMLIFTISLISADTNISDSYIQTTANMTLGQKITFALGEIIDNIVDGFIRITGGLDVTGAINSTDWSNVSIGSWQITDVNALNQTYNATYVSNISSLSSIGEVLNTTIINSNSSWLSTYNSTYVAINTTGNIQG